MNDDIPTHEQNLNMIQKIKNKAMHYWTDHREMVIVVAVVLVIAILTQLNKGQPMEIDRMNYYFTGVLIIMLTLLAFCGGPAT